MNKATKMFAAWVTIILCSLPLANAAEEIRKPFSVNINSASAQMLAEALDGVGQAKAEAIVAYRKQHGAFSSIDALADVTGIGSATLEANKKRLRLK